MKKDGFHTARLTGGDANMDSSDTLYVKDISEELCKHVTFCGKDDIMFCLEQENGLWRAALPSTAAGYIQTWYKEVQK